MDGDGRDGTVVFIMVAVTSGPSTVTRLRKPGKALGTIQGRLPTTNQFNHNHLHQQKIMIAITKHTVGLMYVLGSLPVATHHLWVMVFVAENE